MLHLFPAKVGAFQYNYLGLTLHYRWPRRVHFQQLIDNVGSRSKGWSGRNFTWAGRVVLAKSVLSASGVYPKIVFPIPKWVSRKISKSRRSFIWKGNDEGVAVDGHPFVNWSIICQPTNLEVLGMLNMEHFGCALSLRWPWHQWTNP